MHQKKWVIGNWKMNPATIDEVWSLCESLKGELTTWQDWQQKVAVAIAPSLLHLGLVDYCLAGDDGTHDLPIFLASQDVASHDKTIGAFTGDSSATQIAELAEWTLVGHSERRYHYGENDEILTAKIKNAFEAGLSVVFCIGETKDEYEQGKTKEVLKSQLQLLAQFAQAVSFVEGMPFPRLIVAYEPVWAIGTGLTPTLSEIESTHQFIGELLSDFEISAPILYGGSVNDKNAREIASCQGVDGVLVGGASLKAPSFIEIIKAFCA